MKRTTKYLIIYSLVATAIAGLMTYNTVKLVDLEAAEPAVIYATTTDPYVEYLKEIENRPEFKEWVDLQKEEIYWTEQATQAEQKLDELRKRKLENEQVRADQVAKYLAKRNPDLVPYALEISQLPRYMDVLAIAYQETKLCTVGVGEPGRNNCGGIKSHRGDRTFKVYDNALDALEDISYLLHEPHLVGKTIDEMNGIYCVDEVAGSGACPAWTENIKSEVAVILNS